MDRISIFVCTLMFALVATVAEGQCLIGEPATGDCTQPRQVPGTPGQHVVYMDASNAVGVSPTCGLNTGKRVWYEVTPTVTGPMTISTCHPNTTYDTVLEVFSGGDSNCDFMTPVTCNDDISSDACDNGCSFFGSTVTFNATAGQRYRFVVGAINDNGAGCPLCLGVIVTIDPTCGDPPTNIGPCDAARELPDSPGSHEVLIDVADAVVIPGEQPPNPSCSSAALLGHTVWFHVAPTFRSNMVFSTCHPNTSYDTVVQVFTGGLCTAGGLVGLVTCDDDFPNAACVNGCSQSPRESQVSFDGAPGQDFWIQVGSFNGNNAGCGNLCLGATLDITDCSVSDPPIVSISSPPELSIGCACSPVQIVGSAFGQSTPVREYRIEYRAAGNAIWSEAVTGTSDAVNAVLGQWDTTNLAQGYYLLRITATNACDETSSDTIVTFLDQGFDTVSVRYPPQPSAGNPPPVVAGNVCVDGTVFESWCWHPASSSANFTVKYRPFGASSFTPVDPAHPTYNATVVADPFATWDTLSIPDGLYDLRVSAENDCGQSRSESREVTVDNTPPTAFIGSIQNCDYTDGVMQIMGTASDANLAGWTLQYTGGNATGWVTIQSGSNNVSGGVLGTWDTTNLPDCAYGLRIIATDQAVIGCGGPLRHRSEHVVTVNVGFCGDFDADDDGDVDLVDYGAFQGEFTGPNP